MDKKIPNKNWDVEEIRLFVTDKINLYKYNRLEKEEALDQLRLIFNKKSELELWKKVIDIERNEFILSFVKKFGKQDLNRLKLFLIEIDSNYKTLNFYNTVKNIANYIINILDENDGEPNDVIKNMLSPIFSNDSELWKKIKNGNDYKAQFVELMGIKRMKKLNEIFG
jgi:hypothetical protein